MQDSQVKVVMILLLALQTIPFFITHFLVSGFHYLEEEERKWVVRSSVPINILCNALVWGLTFSAIFRGHSSFTQLIRLQGSYQDAARLVLCSVICIAISAIIAYGGVLAYLRGDREDLHLNRSAAGKVLLLVSLMIIPLLLGVSVSRSGLHHLVISGYCRKTVNYLYNDKTGESEEDNGSYVLIRNGGAFTVEAEGLYLSEDDRVLHNLQLKSVKLGPGESFRQDFTSDESLNVKKNGGSMIFLSDAEGALLDSIVVPALKEEETYLLSDGDWKIAKKTTEDGSTVTVAPPVFSAPGGFYDKEFELTLSSEPGTTIYYSLDSSDPSMEGEKYSAPIRIYNRSSEPDVYAAIENVLHDYKNKFKPSEKPVKKCMVVRAIAVNENGQSSKTVTKSYFVELQNYANENVISLVTDPANLFDAETGIYVVGPQYENWYEQNYQQKSTPKPFNLRIENYWQHGKNWERPATIEAFIAGEPVLVQNVGIRIQGNMSRQNLTKKRFSIYARKEYSGSRYFDETIINGLDQHSWVLREGELHALSQEFGAMRNLLTTERMRVRLFLDGEYWTRTYLYEKVNEENVAKKYDLSPHNIVIVKNGETENADEEKGNNPLSKVYSYPSTHDMSSPENYAEYGQMVDIQSYIDQICFQTYWCNLDVEEVRNNLVWHTVVKENDGVGDTRWRCGLVDMDSNWTEYDHAFGDSYNYRLNPFTTEDNMQIPVTKWSIFVQLRTNEEFCKQLVISYADIMNTVFSEKTVNAILQRNGTQTERIIEFFANRSKYMYEFVAEEFGLSGKTGTIKLLLDQPDKIVTINTATPEFEEHEQEVPETTPWEAWKAQFMEPEPPSYGWEGQYFTEYPVTVSTEEPDFLRWEVTSGGQTNTFTDRTIEVPVVEGGVEIYAVFK